MFLAGSDFELIVDHRPLIPIVNNNKKKQSKLGELSSPRIIRLREKLAPYRLKTVWRPGSDHKVADCLSHHPCGVPTEDDLEGENEVEDACMLMRMAALVDMESGEDILVDRQLLDVQRIGKLDDEYVRWPSFRHRNEVPDNHRNITFFLF